MVTRARDGSAWRVGKDAEVTWITNGTSAGRSITAAIPPVFEALFVEQNRRHHGA